jgi:hypothetical protein
MERGRSEVIASVDDPDEQLGAGSARLTAPALAGLDEVPWAALHHAYGPADDVPGDLRALRSPDPAIRHGAHASLRGSIYHQGTRWQASAYTVPFLIALVDDPATPQRGMVLRLLRAVAIGDRNDTALPFDPALAFAAAAAATDELEAHVLAILAAEESFDEEMMDAAEAVSTRWDRDAYDAGAGRLDRFFAWLRDGDAVVVAGAAELLAWYATTPATSNLVERELVAVPDTPAVARASANLSLAHLPAGTDEPGSVTTTRLTGLLGTADPGVALTAAVALALRMRAAAPEAILSPLMAARDHAVELRETMVDLPWSRSLLGFASLALQRIGLG